MDATQAHSWIAQSPVRRLIIARMHQPLTAAQLAYRVGYHRDVCSYQLTELLINNVVTCLNMIARSNRLYWLTDLGRDVQIKIHIADGKAAMVQEFPRVDWRLYGTVIHRHRAAVIRVLTEAMRPTTVRKRATSAESHLRMSGSNCRDVIRSLQTLGVVHRIKAPRQLFPLYELTHIGRELRSLLIRAKESP